MVELAPALLHELCGRQNAFIVRRNKGAPVVLSRDPMNLRNVPSFRNSGFYNAKAIGLNKGENNSIVLTTKTASKANKPASALHTASFRGSTGSRKLYKKTLEATVKRGYRADLSSDVVYRASALKSALRATKGGRVTKTHGVRRNKRAAKASAAQA